MHDDLKAGKSTESNQALVTEFAVAKKKWKPTDTRQIELTQAILKLIAKDLLPLSLVESDAFREVLEIAQPSYTMPTRKYLCSTLLPHECSTIHDSIKSQLKCAPSVFLTLDLWSSRDMRSFLGVTGHFIVDYSLRSVMLACRRFYGSHTGEAIRDSYQDIASEFGIADKTRYVAQPTW